MFTTSDLVPCEAFVQTRFYKERTRRERQVDFIGAVLNEATTGFARSACCVTSATAWPTRRRDDARGSPFRTCGARCSSAR
jgi:hypothetical protein